MEQILYLKNRKLNNILKEMILLLVVRKLDKTTFEGKGLSKIISATKKSRKKLYLVVGKSELKKVNYGKIVNLRFKNKPTKTNFIETLKKELTLNYFR